MSATFKRNIEIAALIVFGAAGAAISIACIRIIQEHVRHSYSGFGPWQPIFELPFVLFVVAIIVVSIQVAAILLKRPKIQSRKNAILFGVICGAAPISTVIQHCCYWITAGIPHFELGMLFLVVSAAFWFRFKSTPSENGQSLS